MPDDRPTRSSFFRDIGKLFGAFFHEVREGWQEDEWFELFQEELRELKTTFSELREGDRKDLQERFEAMTALLGRTLEERQEDRQVLEQVAENMLQFTVRLGSLEERLAKSQAAEDQEQLGRVRAILERLNTNLRLSQRRSQ